MRLYYAPGLSSLAVRIVACEADLDLAYEKVNLRTQTTADGRTFRSINPKGCVPALELPTGEVLTEVAAVLAYLADSAPAHRLLPEPGSLARYQAQEWMSFIGTELHKGFAPLWKAAVPSAGRKVAVDHLHRRLAYLDTCLWERPYLLGERFSAVDAYCFTILGWVRFHQVDLSPYRGIRHYRARIAERPKVMEALAIEGFGHYRCPWVADIALLDPVPAMPLSRAIP